jgi:hypothetical protein
MAIIASVAMTSRIGTAGWRMTRANGGSRREPRRGGVS